MHVLDVRLAALECLVEFVKADGKADDLNHVLNIVENDPDPGLQHKLMQILVKDPPFKRAHRSKLDTPGLVERIWNNIKYYFFYANRKTVNLNWILVVCFRTILVPVATWWICTTLYTEIGDLFVFLCRNFRA